MNKLLIVIFVVLIAGAGIYFAIPTNVVTEPENQPTNNPSTLITEVEVNITEEQRAKYESRVAELTAEIAVREAEGKYSLDLYFERGANYEHLGKLSLAFADLQIVVAGDPTNETAWNNLGDLSIAMGDINGAEDYYKKAIEQYPAETTYNKLYKYYTQYREEDRADDVGPLLIEAMEKLGPDAAFYVKLGRWYAERGEKDAAIEAYSQAAVLNPDNEAIQEELRQVRNQ